MKKVILILFILFLYTDLFSYKNSFSMGAVFTTCFLRTQVKKDQSKIDNLYKSIIQDSPDGFYSELAYGAGFSLDINTDFLYFNTHFVFPSKPQTNFLISGINSGKNTSVIFDSQAGICYKFFEDKNYPIFLGGGLGFSVFHLKLFGRTPALGDISYVKTDMMLGLGGTASFCYYFTKTFGLNFAISDTIYFMNIKTLRVVSVAGKELTFEEKEKRGVFNAINTLGNTFNLKMGISFRF